MNRSVARALQQTDAASAMHDRLNKALATAVLRLLRPLVRIHLRNGVPYGTLADLVRRSFVDVAWHEYAPKGRKQTISRVSALTGMTRKEVKRLLELGDSQEAPDQLRYSRAVRVISGWLHDRDFQDAGGAPADLPVDGEARSFAMLVRRYSGDIPSRAMLDMLAEAGSVEVESDMVRLVRHAFVPGRDEVGKIEILGIDTAELMDTIDHNMTAPADALYFQRKVSGHHIDPAAVQKLRDLSSRKAQALLEELDRELASLEVDERADSGGKYVSVGIYYHEHDSDRDDST